MQKPLPFLQNCYLEYCLHPGNCGACKKSGHKFMRVSWPWLDGVPAGPTICGCAGRQSLACKALDSNALHATPCMLRLNRGVRQPTLE